MDLARESLVQFCKYATTFLIYNIFLNEILFLEFLYNLLWLRVDHVILDFVVVTLNFLCTPHHLWLLTSMCMFIWRLVNNVWLVRKLQNLSINHSDESKLVWLRLWPLIRGLVLLQSFVLPLVTIPEAKNHLLFLVSLSPEALLGFLLGLLTRMAVEALLLATVAVMVL